MVYREAPLFLDSATAHGACASGTVPARPQQPAPERYGTVLARLETLDRESGLEEFLAALPDPRKARGIRFRLPVLVKLMLYALGTGAKTLAEITSAVAGAPQQVLADAGCTHHDRRGLLAAPSPDTCERVLAVLDAAAAASAAGAFAARRALRAPASYPLAGPAAQPAVAIDGKAVCGAVRADGTRVFVLGAATHTGTVIVAEREIGAKSAETSEFIPLLALLNAHTPLAGLVLTFDAGLTAKANARAVVEQFTAHYVVALKENAGKVYHAICALAFDPLPVGAEMTGKRAHGRSERRTIKVMDAPAHIKQLYPHAAQVFVVDRYTTRRERRPDGTYRTVTTHISQVGVTSMTGREAGPEHLLAYNRGHWAIENKIHWVRDVTLREDASRVRTKNRPHNLVTLRNFLLSLIRLAGHTRIAATIRTMKSDYSLLARILELQIST
jgi:predicted transposase YbfD/YdcC